MMNVHYAPKTDAVPLDAPTPTNHAAAGAEPTPTWIVRGTRDYRRASLGLFFVGFASFALVYGVQPVLPAFADSFRLTPAESSLAMSFTTGLLAVSIMASVMVSQSLGRRGVICGSMALGGALNLAAALSPSWHGLLAARALEGLVLGGVPAIATAYLAEEFDPKSLGRAMGVYIAGNALGGLAGRVGMGLLSELSSWRGAMACLGAFCLISATMAFWLLPVSRNFAPQAGLGPRHHLRSWANLLKTASLAGLFCIGFVLLGVYVTIYNYIGFRLAAAPFSMSQTAISLIFFCVIFGVVSSSVSGALSERFGKRPILVLGFLMILAGIAMTAADQMPWIVGGIACITAGFFIAHPTASAMIGPLSGASKGHSAALYLTSFYVGSSVVGSAGGVVWQHWGWFAVALLTGGFAIAGLLIAIAIELPQQRRPAPTDAPTG